MIPFDKKKIIEKWGRQEVVKKRNIIIIKKLNN